MNEPKPAEEQSNEEKFRRNLADWVVSNRIKHIHVTYVWNRPDPKGQRSFGSCFPSDDDSTSRCGMQFGHRRLFLFALPTPSYLLNFVPPPPSTPSFSFPIFGLWLLSVVHNSALSSCPLFALFNCLLSSIQIKFRPIRCVKLIMCPHSETMTEKNDPKVVRKLSVHYTCNLERIHVPLV